MASRIITALEITEDYIKLAQAEETAQGRILTNLALKKISGKKETEIAGQIAELIQENKIKIKNLIVAIPRHLLTIRTLRLPSTGQAELASMVTLQASKQIPYAPEDIVSDFKIMEIEPNGFSKVLLAIIHKDSVSKYIRILDEAAVMPEQLVISSQALNGWFENFKTKAKNVPDPVAVIDLDSLSADLIIVYKKQLVFSRSINFNAISKDPKEINNFLEEIRHSFSSYQKEKLGPDVARIILTGAGNYFLPLAEKLKAELAIEVETEEPEKYIQKEELLAFPEEVKNKNVSLNHIFGLILLEPSSVLNLIPQDILKHQEKQVKQKRHLFSAALSLLILAVFIGLVLLKFISRDTYLNQLDSQLKQTSPKALDVQKMIKRLELVEQRLSNQGTAIDILYELYRLIPPEISLSVFTLEENGTVTLQGTSMAMSSVFNLVNTLEKSPYFQNVEVKYTSKRRIRDREITEFQIIASVSRLNQKVGRK